MEALFHTPANRSVSVLHCTGKSKREVRMCCIVLHCLCKPRKKIEKKKEGFLNLQYLIYLGLCQGFVILGLFTGGAYWTSLARPGMIWSMSWPG